ncbi:MAG: putative glycoside hydrolase family 2 protein, partial [Streblomastix strix]
ITITDAEGKTAAAAEKKAVKGEQEIPLSIDKPNLWWPAGYGKAYLYSLKVEVVQNGKTVQELQQKIGIRTVELVKKDPAGKQTFYFKVNGRKVLIHGENHIPLDYIKCYATDAEYDRIFKLLENPNVNLIRIWGGGVVEEDSYYERCDEMGILIWHDMFLHSNTYPDYDPEFSANFMAEVEGIIRKVRPHVCFALICGGNEQQEGWDEWGWKGNLDRFYGDKFFNELTPPLAAKLCPDLPYIPNPPSGGPAQAGEFLSIHIKAHIFLEGLGPGITFVGLAGFGNEEGVRGAIVKITPVVTFTDCRRLAVHAAVGGVGNIGKIRTEFGRQRG